MVLQRGWGQAYTPTMYYELGAKIEKNRPITVEMKAYGDVPTREAFEAQLISSLEALIAHILAAKCEHHEGPFKSRIDEPL